MKKKEPSSTITKIPIIERQRVAACLLSLVIKDLFPRSLLGHSGITAKGFYCDIYTDVVFSSDVLRHIEDRIYRALYEKWEVTEKEMVPFAARGYFASCKEPYLSRLMEGRGEQTVFLALLQGKLFPLQGPITLQHMGEVGEIKIFATEEVGKDPRRVRIYGALFDSKEQRKKFSTQGKIQASHITLGRERGWFEEIGEGEWIFFPKGYKVFSLLLHRLERYSEEAGLSWMRIDGEPLDVSSDVFFARHQKIAISSKNFTISECATTCESEDKIFLDGLLDSCYKHMHKAHFFCEKGNLLEKTISCLHFTTKIFKILGFAFQIVLTGKSKGRGSEADVLLSALKASCLPFLEEQEDCLPRVEWRVQDRAQIVWSVSCLYSPRKCSAQLQNRMALPFSLFLSAERVIALLLESNGGKLPSFLSPCQVYIVSAHKEHLEYAKEVAACLSCEDLRVEIVTGDVKVHLKLAYAQGVPHVIVIGDNEVKTRTIAMHEKEGVEPICMTIEELVKICKQE